MMKKSVKKILTIVIVVLLSLTTHTAYSQIFLMDFDQGENPRDPVEVEGFWFVAPMDGQEVDQFTPVGNGVLLLAGLGGAYLLTKKKKKD